jgi:DNA-binding transcriptional MerR regulator
MMFRIGEFSKVAQVSGRLLRYYDEIGLLKPVRIDRDTGYRYYSAQQLPRLNRILALKNLGLTLDQITRLLEDDITPEEIHGMLTMKKVEIEQTLVEEVARLKVVESRLRRINTDEKMPDVVINSIPAQKILSLREIVPKIEGVMGIFVAMQRALPAQVENNRALSFYTAILHSDAFDMENMDIELGYLLTDDIGEATLEYGGFQLAVRDVPAVEMMATIVVQGMDNAGHMAYGALGAWIEAHNYEFAGPTREIFLEFAPPGKEEDAVTEIQFPVRRVDADLNFLS